MEIFIFKIPRFLYFTGYGKNDFVSDELNSTIIKENAIKLNKGIKEMVEDFLKSKKSHLVIEFLTKSRFM